MGDSPEDHQEVFSLLLASRSKVELMADQWRLDGWFYIKAGQRIGPVLPEYIAILVRAEELRPSEQVFQRWKLEGNYRFTECEARSA